MEIPSRIRVILVSGVACACVALPAMAQTPSANEAAYHTLLQQIADQKLTVAQKQVYVAGQQTKIKALRDQIGGLGDVKAGVKPMIEKMVAGIEREIKSDFPFKREERLARLQRLKDSVENQNLSVGEKYRRALNVYRIEVNYGQSMETYSGNHPVSPTIRQGDDRYMLDENGEIMVSEAGLPVEKFDGDYLRYGRTALVYINADGSSPLRYDLGTKEWAALKGGSTEIRRAIRVSKGEVAPGVVMAPVLPMP